MWSKDKRMIKVSRYRFKQLNIWLRIELDAMLVKRTSVLNAAKNRTTSVKLVTSKMLQSVDSVVNN